MDQRSEQPAEVDADGPPGLEQEELTSEEMQVKNVYERFIREGVAPVDGVVTKGSEDDSSIVAGGRNARYSRCSVLSGQSESAKDALQSLERFVILERLERFKNKLFALYLTAFFREDMAEGKLPPLTKVPGHDLLAACCAYYRYENPAVKIRSASNEVHDEQIGRFAFGKFLSSPEQQREHLQRFCDVVEAGFAAMHSSPDGSEVQNIST